MAARSRRPTVMILGTHRLNGPPRLGIRAADNLEPNDGAYFTAAHGYGWERFLFMAAQSCQKTAPDYADMDSVAGWKMNGIFGPASVRRHDSRTIDQPPMASNQPPLRRSFPRFSYRR
jgi:hypothetical protein